MKALRNRHQMFTLGLHRKPTSIMMIESGFMIEEVCNMKSAMAKHILVKTKAEAESIHSKLNQGEDFAKLARQFSLCPSKKRGGDLGEIFPGQLVKPVEQVIFKKPLSQVHGPIKSKFGYHLVVTYFRD